MAKGKTTPEVVHWIIVRLSTAMGEDDIAMYTDVSPATVRSILVFFKTTGGVEGAKAPRPALHKSLRDYDIEVFIQHSLIFNLLLLNI